MSVCLSVCLFVCLLVWVSVCHFVCLFICLYENTPKKLLTSFFGTAFLIPILSICKSVFEHGILEELVESGFYYCWTYFKRLSQFRHYCDKFLKFLSHFILHKFESISIKLLLLLFWLIFFLIPKTYAILTLHHLMLH